MKSFKDKPWYSLTVSICIGVVLFVLLIRFSTVINAVGTFLGFFSTVFLGAVFAYIINPLSKLFYNKVFCKIKKPGTRKGLSNFAALIAIILFLIYATVLVIPQLVDSALTFASNFDGYIASLQSTLLSMGVSTSTIDLNSVVSSSAEIIDEMSEWIKNNLDTIMLTTVDLGKAVGQILIALMLSIYFLAEKDNLKSGGSRFLKAVFKDKYPKVKHFIIKSDSILSRYIVYNLVDALIIGIVNAVFMSLVGLPYVGLVSFLVCITNIIPTFGPIIGMVIGGLILIIVKPWYAGVFVVFSLILQTVDGYVIKPKLFGDSLGVSGLWILVGIVAGGRMFGVIGILLAIPVVAIIDMIYHEYVLPVLEKSN
ncbi:MAG: AI-2E family transporter [Pseudobutyrivibrio sp.]|nr:AI-2E family transporter [Pseudobutyrivibrio sp.]